MNKKKLTKRKKDDSARWRLILGKRVNRKEKARNGWECMGGGRWVLAQDLSPRDHCSKVKLGGFHHEIAMRCLCTSIQVQWLLL